MLGYSVSVFDSLFPLLGDCVMHILFHVIVGGDSAGVERV